MRLRFPFLKTRKHDHSQKPPSFWKKALRFAFYALAAVVITDSLYLAALWPDWEALAKGPVPKSNFIRHYEELRAEDGKLPPLRWRPVPLSRIAPIMGKAAIAAEDSRFYEHDGIDTEAIQEAMEKNIEKGKVVYGASTISQQTVKNMFLSSSRDYLRKWHELLLTWSMERNLSKHRILEIYLNVAEFGPGVYGVEAASRYYWDIPASELSYDQATELAACLPSPKKHNPKTNTRTFQRRVAVIRRHLKSNEPVIDETDEKGGELPPAPTESSTNAPLVAPPAADITSAPEETPLVNPAAATSAPAPAAADPAPGTTTTTPE